MGALENQRHEMFVQELIKGATQRVAYRSAFPNSVKWKDTTVDNRASELFHNSEVLGRYNELQSQATSKNIKTAIERKEWLSSIMDDATEDTTTKLKACDMLNKMDGEYTTKIEADVSYENSLKKVVDEDEY
jgi:hypothetical protein